MNKQRKVLITITYNEMGIIIDTKAEEVAQPNLQPTCNQLATDTISRQAAIDALVKLTNCNGVRELFEYVQEHHLSDMWSGGIVDAIDAVIGVPSVQPGLDEWCTGCKEYDQEKHCCPRWNRVIREALKDAQPEERTNERTETHACDSISRQAAIDAVRHAWAKGLEPTQFLEELPSAQPERKKGRWIKVNGKTAINCSACYHCSWSLSFEYTVKRFNFCPNCGADMRGEQDEET